VSAARRISRREFIGCAVTLASIGRPALARGAVAGCPPSGTGGTGPFEDQRGLIVQRDCDGGDTAQREGFSWFALQLYQSELRLPPPFVRNLSFSSVVDLLEIHHSGLLRRHPDQWNDPKDFSRDQLTPLVAAMGLWKEQGRLLRVWQATVLRGFRAQNGDVIGPDHQNLFLRALGRTPSKLGDQHLVAGVAVRLALAAKNRDDVGDDLNLVVLLVQSAVCSPSSHAASARRSYARHRPHSYGSYLGSYRAAHGTDLTVSGEEMRRRMDDGIERGWRPDASAVQGALRWYFRAETGGNPCLADLYEPIVQKWLSQ
jgi:hypothetical protein